MVGYDRRFLSNEFAQVVAEILAGNDYQVVLADSPIPTPTVSWYTKKQKARFGVMITASHNPARFNGYKLKLHHGGPADVQTCRSIEKKLGTRKIKSIPLTIARKTGKIQILALGV